MCGACGSRVRPDSIMGNSSTVRNRMLVAGVITSVGSGLPGMPRVSALAEGWAVATPTGTTALCHTVEEVWVAVFSGGVPLLPEALQARALTEVPFSLPARVIDAGSQLVQRQQSSSDLEHGSTT